MASSGVIPGGSCVITWAVVGATTALVSISHAVANRVNLAVKKGYILRFRGFGAVGFPSTECMNPLK